MVNIPKGMVTEVFSSIQGEGIYLGERQIFVRLYGCNLNCQFCDTRLNKFTHYTPNELCEEIKSHGNNHHSVSFTGGEPLAQEDFLREILKLSKDNGMRNYLETNGTLPEALESVISNVDIVAMDLKLSSSTGMSNYWDAHRRFLKIASQKEVFIKAVICSVTTEDDLKEGLELISDVDPSAILVLQPNTFDTNAFLKMKLDKFKSICHDHNVTACVIPQMHKILGVK